MQLARLRSDLLIFAPSLLLSPKKEIVIKIQNNLKPQWKGEFFGLLGMVWLL